MTKSRVIVVGAGPMALTYSRTLKALGVEFVVKGRGEDSAALFFKSSGTRPYLRWEDIPNLESFRSAIIAVDVSELVSASMEVLSHGIERLLIEKPGALNMGQLLSWSESHDLSGKEIFIAFNRRYFRVISEAKKRIEEEGGLTSIHFDFSERSRQIEKVQKKAEVKANWLFANSSHVLDTVLFFTDGVSWTATSKAGRLLWHPSGAKFAGIGVSKSGATVTYNSDWLAPAGWEIVARTRLSNLRLKPLEVMTIENHFGEIETLLEKDLDGSDLKPGLMRMTQDFLAPEPSSKLVTLESHLSQREFYARIISFDE